MAEHKPTVERDANGVPTAWLLVRAGPVPLRKNGEDYVLELTSKDLSGIVNYQRTSGERIPIDSKHYLHILAIDRRAGGKDFYNTCHLTNQIYSLRLAVRLPHTFCSKFYCLSPLVVRFPHTFTSKTLLFVASRGQKKVMHSEFSEERSDPRRECVKKKKIECLLVFPGAKQSTTRPPRQSHPIIHSLTDFTANFFKNG